MFFSIPAAIQNESLRADIKQLREQHATDATQLQAVQRDREANEREKNLLKKQRNEVERASQELEMLQQQVSVVNVV